jgi:hypothetical protein
LDNGIIPAGEEAQNILYVADSYSEPELIDALKEFTESEKYDFGDFDVERLRNHIEHDLTIFKEISKLVSGKSIPPSRDAKFLKLKSLIKGESLVKGKLLIFSESAETVDYLYENLNPKEEKEIQKASSGRENKDRLVKLFSPKANNYTLRSNEIEVQMVISTDVLSEGLNLQDCDKVINYDLHWNPVKLIQRFGRIDRIGSTYDKIYGYNFLPETELDKNLGLHEIVHNRIQEIHDTIGEDAEILDGTEKLNPEAMYAIYQEESDKLAGLEDGGDYLDIDEAEELLRQLKNDDPLEYERIANLGDGIRAAQKVKADHLYVFCQAGKKEKFNQLYLQNIDGKIISRDIAEILGRIKVYPNAIGVPLPRNINEKVDKVRRSFKEEVYSRISEKKHASSLTKAQQYIVRELRLIFADSDNEDLKSEINYFDKIFRNVDRIAVKNEMNKIRKNGLTGSSLLRKLQEINVKHSLYEMAEMETESETPAIKVICCELL